EVGTDPILDPAANLRGRINLPLAPIAGDGRHPIVDPLINQYVIVPRATPLTVVDSTTAGSLQPASAPNNRVRAAAILRTSPRPWAESDPRPPRPQFDERDKRGPFVVGVADSERPASGAPAEETPRMVVFSSPQLADNQFVAIDPANLDLVVN